MKLGIKVGLRPESVANLVATKPDFCEIWFHSGKIDQYDDLFRQIKRLGPKIGLHFWGALADDTEANLSFPDSLILEASKKLVKKTIETAARNGCFYVNVHPGASRLSRIDFEAEQVYPYGKQLEVTDCHESLQASLTELAEFAKNVGVELYIESVPRHFLGHPWHGTQGRLKPVVIGQIPVTIIAQILKQSVANLYFTNDFGHTASNLVTNDRTIIKDGLFTTTRSLATFTKLLHVSYIIAPYNGTDYHGCLYYPEVNSSTAVPNHDETKQLLKLFVDRPDVAALVEPETDHVGNFAVLKTLVTEAQKSA
ncbi:MAG: hypothetical protein UV61_C0008G0141 [Candidatus Gottesmanbacteria bacterium GW2011_GWB1_43_11]|uniref:Xylose isomerase-like TIM barrel domain-containing protein n=1 Tax=Candidatus Gottesmanbacteria bacterium GW2011_GWB1_43_11 TaxID=1618446 RepID=A0A0G1FIM7_9BACT|nr:MAG: hypothetical protein UV04_C0009G0026 [Candidatus Gottesmanbacteria bacterium GW2011_GWA2_42_16]KKS53834.1 MAG: hypothetical protein UV17_C0030G0007 [Candidatus Gottesmanbacteria bacterium GW2011_GWA1_42_26]KKS81436.1 MAG: hypothetical protein UV55_C0014G0025 [Candidatus Gottesmanbacteria bacterium GW2011_GWC1_43_10]KKS86688.1 MAG: hypothetical protein UV61_C0008G0141 [Candidatus Gottesmanbacteria bacterium GW2011_GWB1_43_11]OGG08559.1 MAG: hypothetical protein A2699_00055 [Candidatus Go